MIEDFPEVLARSRSGDPEALARLYVALNPTLERYLRTRAPQAAEDLAAETWVAVAESIQRFRGDETDFRGWVFTIARNRLIDDHRRTQRRPQVAALPDDDDQDDPVASDATEDAALGALETEAVLRLLQALPADQADVIALRVVAGLDTARVAKVLGKRAGAIRVLQHRGLRTLQRLLDDAAGSGGAS